MKRFLLAVLLSSTAACATTICTLHPPVPNFTTGGAYVTYVQPTHCEGCQALRRGDLIQTIDGEPAHSAAAVEAANITDGKPHEIVFKRYGRDGLFEQMITITARPNAAMAPVSDAPPFWTVDARVLNEAPGSWARRRLFAHASPQLLLVDVDGGLINGRDLYGKKRIMVFFDWASQDDQRNGAIALKVLQLAGNQLEAANVEPMLIQVMHPSERPRPPMNDTNLRAFFTSNQVTEREGGPLPPPPMYRSPNRTEDNPAQTLGLEGAFNYLENIGEAPNVIILDEYAVIRWHSAGPIPGEAHEADMLLVMNEAVNFAAKMDQ